MTRPRVSVPWLSACLAVGLTLGGLLVGFEPVGGDPDRIFRPIKEELGRSPRDGSLPFWSDRFGLGVPLVAESHVAAFYPLNMLIYRLLNVSTAYRLSMWFHYVLLVSTTYAYAKALGITPWGAAIASLAFALCGFQAIHSSHEWAYHTLAYLPLALLAADRYATSGRWARLALLALAWGMQVTLGHFQVQMWTGVLVVLTGGWRVIADGRPWSRVLGLGAAIAWGAAIAAVQIGPTWELATIVGQTRRSFADLAFYSYPPSHWPELAIPGLFRGVRGGPEAAYWFGQQTTGFESCLYVGTIPLILAFVGLVGGGRSLRVWRVIVPASLALATMPRWWPEGYALVLRIPGLGLFRCPARYTAITSFGLALLAGGGLDRAIARRRFGMGLVLAVLFGIAALAWALRPVFDRLFAADWLATRLGLAASAWGVGVMALLAWRRGWLGGWTPCALTLVELSILYYTGTTRWGWAVPLPEASPVLRRLADERRPVRVIGPLDNLPARAGFVAGSPYFGFPMPGPNRVLEAIKQSRVPEAARGEALRALGVTHEVGFGPAHRVGDVIFEGADPALDRLAYRPTGVPERRSWWIVRLAEPLPEVRVSPGSRVVRWDGRSGEVEHDGPCTLVIARAAYPGWTASVDGIERPLTSNGWGMQAIELDGSGVSRVTIRFRPTGWTFALATSLLATTTALAVLATGFLAHRRGRASPHAASA